MNCEHKPNVQARTERARNGLTGGLEYLASQEPIHRNNCPCGAVRIDAQIGLEPTPEAYVATMVGVFREVRRVLRDNGTVWLNLGDSYFGSSQGWGDTKTTNKGHNGSRERQRPEWPDCGLKPKDLCGIPWRVAFALQADGWYLRSDIIWAKPNPMPESVTDRPTRSHEYIFLLSKSERYFFDQDSIREPSQDTAGVAYVDENGAKHYREAWTDNKGRDPKKDLGSWASKYGSTTHPMGRNKRSVWTVNSSPTPEAHFATFPSKLVEPCILAGSRAGDLVFDPFLGSGTTGRVAERLGRRWVGLELSEPYIQIAKNRTAQIGLEI